MKSDNDRTLRSGESSRLNQPVKSSDKLPVGYDKWETINLSKNPKELWTVNGISLVLMLVLLAAGFMLHPGTNRLFDELFEGWRWVILCVAYLLYIVAHEWVHGIVMKHYFPESVHYGFNGAYAYAGSNAYYNKSNYITIAMAPVVVWGLVFVCLQLIVPASWFWVVWLLQAMNISGAAGDFYVAWHFRHLPDSILIQDTGLEMTVYGPGAEPQTK